MKHLMKSVGLAIATAYVFTCVMPTALAATDVLHIRVENPSAMQVGETQALQFTMEPSEATWKDVRFISGNSNVVSINPRGWLHAIGEGSTTVQVEARSGSVKVYKRVTIQVGDGQANPPESAAHTAEAPAPSTERNIGSRQATPLSELETQVLDMVNAEREKEQLQKLEYSESLQATAKVRASELPTSFSHTRPDGTPWYTALEDQNSFSGENLAMGFTSAQGVMNGWMNSEGHKNNILMKDFRKLGVSVIQVQGVLYWAQEFST